MMQDWWRLVAGLLVAVGIALAAAPEAFGDYVVTPTCTSDSQTVQCDGWHKGPIQIKWSWTPDTATQEQGCVTQDFTSDTRTPMTGPAPFCDVNGPEGPAGVSQNIDVETTNPTATPNLTRHPDSNGWFDHPVTISFAGSSFSGISSCTSPVIYSGPTAGNATVSGSCTDNAGKVAKATVSFKYDATPPTITGATALRRPDYHGWYTHAVSFAFKGTDSGSGIERCQTVTYAGPSSGSVAGGCWDGAGNYAAIHLPVRFLDVVSRASASRVPPVPLLLRWKARRHASYYNVQIYRGTHKVLSRWPSAASLFLSPSWRFRHHRFRLRPGRYHWYVWPGYGARATDRYGRMIVSGKFTVT